MRGAVRRVRVLAAFTLCALAVATAVLVMVIGRALDSSRTSLIDVEATLTDAGRLATSTADVADRISKLGDGVAGGINASANALDATQTLAASVSQLIDVLATVSSRVRSVSADLTTASQQLRDFQAALRSSEQQVRALLPELQTSAASLRDLPVRLDNAAKSAANTRDALGPIGTLGRVAVVLVAVALAGIVLVTAESAVLRARAPR